MIVGWANALIYLSAFELFKKEWISTHIYAYLLTYVGAADGDLLAGLHSDLLRDLLVPVEDDEVLRLRGGRQDARHVVSSSCKNISYSVQKYFLLCATGDLLQGVAAGRAGQELAQPHSGLAPANSHRVKGGNSLDSLTRRTVHFSVFTKQFPTFLCSQWLNNEMEK